MDSSTLTPDLHLETWVDEQCCTTTVTHRATGKREVWMHNKELYLSDKERAIDELLLAIQSASPTEGMES